MTPLLQVFLHISFLVENSKFSRLILHLVFTYDIIHVIIREVVTTCMKKKETVTMQNEYIDALSKNLPVLRASTNMTQAQLAYKVGVSRQTIVSIETGKRPMPWSLYLATIFVFEQYTESRILLRKLMLFSTEFIVNVL